MFITKHCYCNQMGAALCIYRNHHNIMMCDLLDVKIATHGMQLHLAPQRPSQKNLSQARLDWYVDIIFRILQCPHF